MAAIVLLILIGVWGYFMMKICNRMAEQKERERRKEFERQHPKPPVPVKPVVQEQPKVEQPKIEHLKTRFYIAGVTFKDGRLSRQAAIRMLKFGDGVMKGPVAFEFEEYEFEGKPAVKIIANDRILGHVPADIVDDFIAKMKEYPDFQVQYNAYGGGQGRSYGCEMVIIWK